MSVASRFYTRHGCLCFVKCTDCVGSYQARRHGGNLVGATRLLGASQAERRSCKRALRERTPTNQWAVQCVRARLSLNTGVPCTKGVVAVQMEEGVDVQLEAEVAAVAGAAVVMVTMMHIRIGTAIPYLHGV